jgi:hypothetical protein
MVVDFKSKLLGLTLPAIMEMDISDSGRSMVIMHLRDYQGALSQAHTIPEAIELLDEVLDVMLTLDLECDLAPLGYDLDLDTNTFRYVARA